MGLEQMAYGAVGAIVLFYTATFVWSLPAKIWYAIVPKKIADSVRLLLHRMFFRKLTERYKDDEVRLALVLLVKRYFPVTIMCIWWGPKVLLFLHYLSAGACGFNLTRPYMETCGMCLPNLQNNTTWFLELWDDQANITDYSQTPSDYIRTIMISHLPMYNVQLVLQDQAVKLQLTLPDGIKDEKVMNSLNQSIDIASGLTTQMHSFARMLCMEKDIMTSALRTFVDAYSKTITISNHGAVSLASIAFWPWVHSLRFLNRQWLTPLLPEPRIYSFEIEAELRFQKVQLIGTIKESLALLDANSPAIQNFDSLGVAISTITTLLRKLEQMIRESDSSRWLWSPKSNETSNLQKYHKDLEHTRDYMVAVLEIAQVYKIMFSRLWNDLQAFPQAFSKRLPSRFTATGSLAIPEFLLAQVQNISFVSPWQSSSIDQDSDGSDVSNLSPTTSLFGYSLNNIDDTQLSAGRSAIALFCKAGNIESDPEDNLYTICTIYRLAATMSGLDKDVLSSTARSWMVEMEKATLSFDKERGFDLDGVRRVLEKLADEEAGR